MIHYTGQKTETQIQFQFLFRWLLDQYEHIQTTYRHIDTYRDPVPLWNLHLVLTQLMSSPFEPLQHCSLFQLSIKIAFIIAITSATRINELHALMADPPYTNFQRDKLVVRPHLKFNPKIVSDFYVNQCINLPIFFPKPHISKEDARLHSLDEKRILSYYLDRSKDFRSYPKLFISLYWFFKGQAISAQSLSRWVHYIEECYRTALLFPLQVLEVILLEEWLCLQHFSSMFPLLKFARRLHGEQSMLLQVTIHQIQNLGPMLVLASQYFKSLFNQDSVPLLLRYCSPNFPKGGNMQRTL